MKPICTLNNRPDYAFLNSVSGQVYADALADLVILDRDPYAMPPSDIAATKVHATYIGGQRVYQA